MTTKEYESYYVPAQSKWPIVGAIALFLIAVGAGNYVSNLNMKLSIEKFVYSVNSTITTTLNYKILKFL